MPRTTKKTIAPIEKHTIPTVPVAEQPYQVPENWRWVRLGEIYVINPPVEGDDSMDVSFVPMEKVNPGMCSDFTFDILPWKQAKKGHTRFANGDIAFAKISPCFENRKAFIATGLLNGIGGGTTELIILRHSKILQKYTYYSIMADRFINGGVQTYSGTVGQQRISMDYVRNYPFPLPPLAEQQRIVNRIESLFAKLDEAREKAQTVVDGFENRKAAILHQAFTGELTRKWREERGIGMESWKPSTSTDLFEYVTSGSRGWAQYYSDYGQVFIRMGNLDHGTIEIDLTDIQYVNLPDKAEGQRSLIKKGDILISITADVGMIGLVRDINFEAYINQHIALARPVKIENSEFIAWYLVSDVGLSQFKNKQRGATKIGLGLNDIRSLTLNMPCVDEQKLILRIISNSIIKEQRARDLAESVIVQIDGMKKAILARAFRGELGTNDPSEAACEVP